MHSQRLQSHLPFGTMNRSSKKVAMIMWTQPLPRPSKRTKRIISKCMWWKSVDATAKFAKSICIRCTKVAVAATVTATAAATITAIETAKNEIRTRNLNRIRTSITIRSVNKKRPTAQTLRKWLMCTMDKIMLAPSHTITSTNRKSKSSIIITIIITIMSKRWSRRNRIQLKKSYRYEHWTAPALLGMNRIWFR